MSTWFAKLILTNSSNIAKNQGCRIVYLFINFIVYRNTWLGNTYYDLCYSVNMLNIRSFGFHRTHYYLIYGDITWNMLSKFSKQIF